MGLNDIRLNSSVAASLYRNTLVEIDSKDAVQQPEPLVPVTETAWKHLGNNKKNILLVVDYSNVTYLPDEELNFLASILAACKLDLGDVAIVNRQHYLEHNYKNILDHFTSKTILLFGIDPVDFGLPMAFPQFQVQAFNNSTFLYSTVLEECRKDKLLKSKLWVSLQKIFGI